VRPPFLILILSLLSIADAAAYERQLTSQSVYEAYFLGRRRDDKTAQFLAQYVKRLPLPKTGLHVSDIEIRTPYQQVVLRAWQAPEGYSAQLAEEEYRARAALVLLRIRIILTPTYMPRGRSDDHWRESVISLVQTKEIRPKKIGGRPIYSSSEHGLSFLTGWEIELDFDVSQVDSVPTRVKVVAPDGQSVECQFDLRQLP